MRCQQKKRQKQSTGTGLRRALSIVSAIATIIGTIMAVVDTLHRW